MGTVSGHSDSLDHKFDTYFLSPFGAHGCGAISAFPAVIDVGFLSRAGGARIHRVRMLCVPYIGALQYLARAVKMRKLLPWLQAGTDGGVSKSCKD